MENILVDNFIQVYFSLYGKISDSELKKICNMGFFAWFCSSQSTIYNVHAWQLLCFWRWGWGDDDISDVGDKTGENTLSLTHSLTHSLKIKKDFESWGILSVSASYPSGYFERSPRHWRVLPAQSADERSWCTLHCIPKNCVQGCSSYTHLSRLFWCTWVTSLSADLCATYIRQLIGAPSVPISLFVPLTV